MTHGLLILSAMALTCIAAAEVPGADMESLDGQVRRFQQMIDAGRLDDADSVAAQAAAAHPENAAAQLMLRHIEVLKQASKTVASARGKSEPRLTSVRYAVADLVIPVPAEVAIRIEQTTAPDIAMRPAIEQPGFELLLNTIKRQVAPGAWGENGGSIVAHKETLSIVVRQTPDVHDQIAELLREMRRELDLQVSLEIRWLEVPDGFLETLGADFAWEPTDFPDSLVVRCDAAEQKRLLVAAQQHPQTNTVSAPKVTLFNGQVARIAFADQKERLLHASVSNDRRRLRLTVAEHSIRAADVLASAEVHSLAAGQSLLLDASDAGRDDVPALNKVPYISRLFKNPENQNTRRLLLVTPKIFVVEEEEELLGIDLGPKPNPDR